MKLRDTLLICGAIVVAGCLVALLPRILPPQPATPVSLAKDAKPDPQIEPPEKPPAAPLAPAPKTSNAPQVRKVMAKSWKGYSRTLPHFSKDWTRAAQLVERGDRFDVEVWDISTNQNRFTGRGSWKESYQVSSGGGVRRKVVEITATCVAIRPDGHCVAIASDVLIDLDGTKTTSHGIELWMVDKDKPYRTIENQAATINGLAFSTDGRRLASASADKKASIWDSSSGEKIIDLDNPLYGFLRSQIIGSGDERVARVYQCRPVFSQDGERLAILNPNNTVVLWDARTGKQLLSLSDQFGDIAISPDNNRLVALNWNLNIWEIATQSSVVLFKGNPERGLFPRVAYSPDGKYLATGIPSDTGFPTPKNPMIRIWNAKTHEPLFDLWLVSEGNYGVIHEAIRMAFSPDSKTLWANCGALFSWDLPAGP